ncbi:MAG: ATP-binding protein [Candidatus Nitrosocosmicus sp.]
MLSRKEIEKITNICTSEIINRKGNNAYDIIDKLLERNVNVIDILNIISKIQSQIGELWALNMITISDEHYATQITLDLLGNIANKLKLIDSIKEKFKGSALLFVVEGELHYIGLKMFSLLLSKIGWDVDFLGQSMPLNDLLSSISNQNKKYDLVAISVTLSTNLPALIKTLKNIKTHPLLNESVIIIGSKLFNSVKHYKSFEKDLLLSDYMVTNIFDGLKITLALQKISIKTRKELEQLISFEQQRYQQLKETERLKEEYLSMISHELRTPLIPIKGYTEMLLKSDIMGSITENQRKALQSIYRNIEKEEYLVSDIFDILKLELGELRIVKKEVIISRIFSDVINDLKPLAEEEKVTLLSDIKTTLTNTVFCDKKRIEQVLSNLIKNSIDFVPKENGKIILIAEEEKENRFKEANNKNNTYTEIENSSNIIFSIKDNGPGIPSDKTNNVFKKFYQIDTNANRKHTGTGLGLVICKGIVEAHGGNIWIDKNKIGQFVIKFSIPLSDKKVNKNIGY